MRLLVPLAILAALSLGAPSALADEPLSTEVAERDAQKRARLAELQQQHEERVAGTQAQADYERKLVEWRDSVDGARSGRRLAAIIGLVVGAGEVTAGAIVLSNAEGETDKARNDKKLGYLGVGGGVLTLGLGLYYLFTLPNADDMLAERQQAAWRNPALFRF